MVEPFADFVIPPLLQTAGLLVVPARVFAVLLAGRPPINQTMVLAFAPWIVVGAILHVFYQVGVTLKQPLFPAPIEPFFSAPAVYLTVFIVMGLIWAVSTMFMTNPDANQIGQYLSGMGVGTMVPLIALLLWRGTDPGIRPMEPVFPVAGLLVAIGGTFLVSLALGLWRTGMFAKVQYVAPLVLFAHLFDGVTTAVGVDFLGAEERSTIPRMILDAGASLPTASAIGSGWLFVLMGLIVAVGLGPGTFNFFLFVLSP